MTNLDRNWLVVGLALLLLLDLPGRALRWRRMRRPNPCLASAPDRRLA